MTKVVATSILLSRQKIRYLRQLPPVIDGRQPTPSTDLRHPCSLEAERCQKAGFECAARQVSRLFAVDQHSLPHSVIHCGQNTVVYCGFSFAFRHPSSACVVNRCLELGVLLTPRAQTNTCTFSFSTIGCVTHTHTHTHTHSSTHARTHLSLRLS